MTSTVLSDFERTVKCDIAAASILEVAANVAQSYNISFEIHRDGPIHAVYAYSANNTQVTYGLGKGPSSLIGAYGECIEHLHYKEIGRYSEHIIMCSEFCELQTAKADCILNYAFSLDDHPVAIPCIPFRNLLNGDSIHLPTYYFNYHLLEKDVELKKAFYVFLSRYVTTSGTAFGLTEADATLHALNEIIERHITSTFLLYICGYQYKSTMHFQTVDLSTVPSNMTQPLREIVSLSGGYPQLCVTKTHFGGWWAFCLSSPCPAKSPYILPQWGAGFSLSFDVAVFRAISECLQMLTAYNDENKNEDRKLCLFLKQFPRFAPVANIAAFLPRSNVPFKDISLCATIDLSMTVSEQIETIAKGMALAGATPYVHVAIQECLFSIVTAYAPNLERFYNITKCAPVLPLQYIRKNMPDNKAMHRGCWSSIS